MIRVLTCAYDFTSLSSPRIEQEFVHPVYGPVKVTAELWYVSEEQPDHVKSRPSGYERYCQPIDPNKKKKLHVADVRVVYYLKVKGQTHCAPAGA
jgi:hypothetical protein